MGAASASTIAKQANSKRTTAYKLLEELVNEQLLEKDPSTKITTYIAVSPTVLIKSLNHKKQQAENLLPHLLAAFKETTHKPVVRFYSGVSGIKKAFDDALTSREKVIYTFSPIKNVLQTLGPAYARHYIEKRKKNKIWRKSLRQPTKGTIKTKDWEFYADSEAALRQVRFLPKNISFESSIQIYDDKISIISYTDNVFAFIIENKKLADFLKQLFQLLWQMADYKN